jgi:hypothetical protein
MTSSGDGPIDRRAGSPVDPSAYPGPVTQREPGDELIAASFEGWIEHRRADDRELVGWIVPDGNGFTARDRLGRPVTECTDRAGAEEALDARGLAFLADLWQLDADPRWGPGLLRARLVEVTPDRVVVKQDDFGAIDAGSGPPRSVTLPFPAPPGLRPFPGDPGHIASTGS